MPGSGASISRVLGRIPGMSDMLTVFTRSSFACRLEAFIWGSIVFICYFASFSMFFIFIGGTY
jgi:hypothetical protein